jgi:hypothetical protein
LSQQAVTNSTCLIGLERIGQTELMRVDFRISNRILQEALRLSGESDS